jgi:hypothetical protein
MVKIYSLHSPAPPCRVSQIIVYNFVFDKKIILPNNMVNYCFARFLGVFHLWGWSQKRRKGRVPYLRFRWEAPGLVGAHRSYSQQAAATLPVSATTGERKTPTQIPGLALVAGRAWADLGRLPSKVVPQVDGFRCQPTSHLQGRPCESNSETVPRVDPQ